MLLNLLHFFPTDITNTRMDCPRAVVVISGKRKSGKDFISEILLNRLQILHDFYNETKISFLFDN